jgi:hypothetical protein
MPHMRKLLCGGDILLGTVLSVCLTKLSLKAPKHCSDAAKCTNLCLRALHVCAGVGKFAESKRGSRNGVHADCLDRLSQCCRMLLDPQVKEKLGEIFLTSCQNAFSALVSSQRKAKNDAAENLKKSVASQADDLIQFRQLRA